MRDHPAIFLKAEVEKSGQLFGKCQERKVLV
jgi:hypothetical protein